MNTQNRDNDKQLHPVQSIHRLVIGLIILSFMVIVGRLMFFGQTQLTGGDSLWRLSIELVIKAEKKPTSVQISPPFETAGIRVVQRILNHPGFRIRNWSEEKEQRRSILAYATANGRRSMSTEFILLQGKSAPVENQVKKTPLTNRQREKYLQDNDSLQILSPIVAETLRQISKGQTDRETLIDGIFRFLQLFAVNFGKDDLHVPTTLAEKKATTLDRSMAMVALCRSAGIPARIITGLILQDEIEPRLHYWVEVYHDDRWLSFDIQSGYRYNVPGNYLTLVQDDTDIIKVRNGELLQLDLDLEREFEHPYLRQNKKRHYLNIVDLTRLPLDMRNELAILLLLPMGILITALCRHLVGLHSYGVFTPTLLALALVYTNIIITLVIFMVICTLAIGGRSLFPARISRVPRLAIIFTLVAIILSLSISTLDYFDVQQGGKIILLPIIILTSLIDRLYRTIEEKGMQIAMRRLVWTILIALLCLPVIQFERLGHLLLNYPEFHFSTLALFLLISTYKGKQLINLPLIRLLAEPDAPKKKTKNADDSQPGGIE